MAQTNEPLLSVKGLKQYFPVSKKFTVRAVDNISFDIYPGETYGLVGESGSGKSTTGRSIIRLYDPTEGTILFNGEDISKKLTAKQEKMLRSDMQMVFQDPMASLNPHKKDFGYYCDGSRCASSSYGSKGARRARVQNDGDGRFKSSLYEPLS